MLSDNADGSYAESRSKSLSDMNKFGRQSSSNTDGKERSRCRSWVQHPASTSAYSPRRRPPTPPNIVRHGETIRPTLAKFADSLYPDNTIEGSTQEITIPRALTMYGKTPQNINSIRADGISTSSESSISPTSNIQYPYTTRTVETHEPKGPVVMYTDLQFPPSPSQLQELVSRKKDSSGSSITMKAKLSSDIKEHNRFEQSIMRSRDDIFKRNSDEGNL